MDGRLDFHRFVLLVTHRFSDRIRFVGELEVEHAFVEGIRSSTGGGCRCSRISCCTTPAGDGVKQAAAEPGEFRTPALWGLRFRRPLLHDGSASTVEDAIRRHAGEAERARERFDRLGPNDAATLFRFLRSL